MKRDDEHKMVKSKEVKDEEVVRVPIAFAMVRLMQTLPEDVMETNLPGCVPCVFENHMLETSSI